ncbi:histidinol-phosphatase [Sulfitobacter mediterraneus]|uniref:Histidinol-phosphatase n=1 Tax=Sulfitobacter mediterraneus TaxID=83219 RepID=A0A2T6CCK3_9RHOB|nr:histidinol-phosphatase [Sulfitobacter mediterraneus]KIN78081.1 Inositol monophosphatase family protein [Sulfitobacter mediterraneus KCTC 32188]PTX73246.1 myo-inositol-1(or 4)-monophosphatase [Sulfitobacter mediterraneus]
MTKHNDFDSDIRRVAHLMADAARLVILPYFRNAALTAENKLDGGYDPVTEADRAAERAMRDILARERPADGILGEEYGASDGTSGLTWVLDPIDGTRGFVSGTPTWGVLIAVSDGQGPFYGIIDQPYIGERYEGAPDGAAFEGPHSAGAIQTLAPKPLSDAVVFTTFPEVGTAADQAGFHAVAAQARLTRYGMDCYAYALLAAGQVDLVIEAGLNPYDIQAPIAVVQAAGGIVTDWQGGPAHDGGRAIAAANADIHAAALAILKDC